MAMPDLACNTGAHAMVAGVAEDTMGLVMTNELISGMGDTFGWVLSLPQPFTQTLTGLQKHPQSVFQYG